MHVGLISPYSLTIPGGVQGQVLGLARSLRALGQDTRVLGPCDGPPPDAGVTPLGNSVPTAANGSVAPLAPDPSAQLRTIRAVRDERFDVLHVHEPMCPGPTMTALLSKNSPLVGTFHAAGVSAGYRWLRQQQVEQQGGQAMALQHLRDTPVARARAAAAAAVREHHHAQRVIGQREFAFERMQPDMHLLRDRCFAKGRRGRHRVQPLPFPPTLPRAGTARP